MGLRQISLSRLWILEAKSSCMWTVPCVSVKLFNLTRYRFGSFFSQFLKFFSSKKFLLLDFWIFWQSGQLGISVFVNCCRFYQRVKCRFQSKTNLSTPGGKILYIPQQNPLVLAFFSKVRSKLKILTVVTTLKVLSKRRWWLNSL